MQLKNKSVRRSLAVATASLLGSAGASNAHALENSSDWEVDTSVLYYSEDGRVSLWEPVIRVKKDYGNDRFLTFKTVVDTLTGSSANGAIATGSAQTFTSPSGNATYTTPTNETPLDPSFHDTRVAVNLDWEQPLGKDLRTNLGINYSTEFDYNSLGLSGMFNWDFNQKNSTFTAGLSVNNDTIEPVGGAPVGLTNMPVFPTTKQIISGSQDKTVYDFILGWTQVMSRKDLLRINYVYGNEDGYLSDPYKILSVVDGVTGDLVADPAQRYVYESRPDSRSRHSLYMKWAHQFTDDVYRLSYRYYTDDWGINSHTLETSYRFELNSKHFLEPYLRYYTQSAADFYNTSLVDGQIPQYASADYRLADLTTTTLGLKYGWNVSDESEFGLRVGLMNQQADPSVVIGNQSQQDLVPEISATLFQLNYTLQF